MFEHYKDLEYYVAAIQLSLAMSGMGATLSWRDFHDILRRPHGVGLVLLIQYLVFPLLAVGIAELLDLPVGISIGLLVVTVMPSGSLSNVFTHLGKGNVPLSITATTASTLSCLILTPLILRMFVSNLSDSFQMPVETIVLQILLFMVLPLAIGMVAGHLLKHVRVTISKWLVRASLVALLYIVVGALGSGRINIAEFGWWLPVLLVGFGIVKLLLTEAIARLASFTPRDAFTIAIEVGIRNCNLAVLLLAYFFPAADPQSSRLGGDVLYVVLFYGGASLFIAAVPITQRYLTIAK